MKVIKRDGRVVDYNKEKIVVAIQKANQEVMQTKRATNEENKIPNEALLDDTQNPKTPQKEDIEPEKQEELYPTNQRELKLK